MGEDEGGRTFYVVFHDEAMTTYGYWLGESEEELRQLAQGERGMEVKGFGWFPSEEQEVAELVLREACGLDWEGEAPLFIGACEEEDDADADDPPGPTHPSCRVGPEDAQYEETLFMCLFLDAYGSDAWFRMKLRGLNWHA